MGPSPAPARNHRSLQGELMSLIERAVGEPFTQGPMSVDIIRQDRASR